MNKSLILGKKQIILCCLVMALGIAVYMNWRIVDEGEDFAAANVTQTDAAASGTDDTVKKYGDSQYVDSQNIDGGDSVNGDIYFSEAKLTRQKTRDEAVETLQVIMSNVEVDSEAKADLAVQAAAIASAIEAEGKVENLIKAKGFSECMVYLDEDRASVIVRADELLDNEVAQIKDIILKETSVPVENISIVDVK
jgi:stage III sporulation protein AH